MTTQSPDIPGVIAPPPLLFVAAIVIGLLLDWLFPAYVLYLLLPTWLRVILAVLCLATSAVLTLPAIISFRSAGTNIEPWKPSTVLITAGVYGFMRNPIYVGGVLACGGIALLCDSDWMLVMTIVYALVLHYGVVLREERYLAAKFGEAYRRYIESVPRYGLSL